MKYYVYILTNSNNRVLYVGVTNDIVRRMSEHKSDINKGFSHKYRTHKLVYFEEYSHPMDAIKREKELKGFLRIKKIELIEKFNPQWNDLSQYF